MLRWTRTPVARCRPCRPGAWKPVRAACRRLGQAVRKGEVLAYVLPASDSLERASQTAQLAELRAAQGLAAKRLARLKELADSVPRKEIEAAESELASLTTRGAAIAGGLGGREALLAPVSGVIASAHAVAGQVLEARASWSLKWWTRHACASRP